MHAFAMHQEDAMLGAVNLALSPSDSYYGWKLWIMLLTIALEENNTSNSISVMHSFNKTCYTEPNISINMKQYFIVSEESLTSLQAKYVVQRHGTLVFTAGALHQGGGEVILQKKNIYTYISQEY